MNLLEDYDQNTGVSYERWSKTDSVYSLLEWHVFLATIGSMEGLDVLDVASGEGRLSRLLMDITVNAIAPTVFRSALTAWMFGDDELGRATRERSLARIPLGRLGEVDDLLGMAIYLLSPASDFCTGQVMYVDGGYTAG